MLDDPHPNGCKRLSGVDHNGAPVYRIRCGDYRALYCVTEDETLIVLDIGNRKDIYRG